MTVQAARLRPDRLADAVLALAACLSKVPDFFKGQILHVYLHTCVYI